MINAKVIFTKRFYSFGVEVLKEVVGDKQWSARKGKGAGGVFCSNFWWNFFVEMPYYSGAYLPLSESWIDEDDVRVRH